MYIIFDNAEIGFFWFLKILLIVSKVSNFNIFYLDEYLKWTRSTGIPHYWNILYYNPWFSIKNLPSTAKTIINSKYVNDDEFTNLLNFMNLSADETLFDQFLNDVKDICVYN